MNDPIINKVAESGLVTLDLEKYYPREEIVLFDLKDYLFMGMILKEKDFREALKNKDWEGYRDKSVGIICSADAIIPPWAYMLVVSYLQPIVKDVEMGDDTLVRKMNFLRNIRNINAQDFSGQKVVIKGCGDIPIDDAAYMEVTKMLRPFAASIMYGEPCSTVPIYKARIPASSQKKI